jgi:hypothetical protein
MPQEDAIKAAKALKPGLEQSINPLQKYHTHYFLV